MIGFAHRGAPTAGARENTLAAFEHALRRGARALESDVWLTLDGVAVLDHDGMVRRGLSRRPISTIPAEHLPAWIPPLEQLYETTGGDFDFCLDVKDPAAAGPVVEVARRHERAGQLWLCGSAAQVRGWQPMAEGPRLVVSTTLRTGGASRRMDDARIDEAATAGAAAINLRAPEWNADRVRRCHDQHLLAFAWDVQQRGILERTREYGCDAIFSDSLTLLAAA